MAKLGTLLTVLAACARPAAPAGDWRVVYWADGTLSQDAYADDFHVFAVAWQPQEIRWFVDGRLYHRLTPADLPSGANWVFDHPCFLLLDVAVGGSWPGDPNASTTFPQQMVVDYVRVYNEP